MFRIVRTVLVAGLVTLAVTSTAAAKEGVQLSSIPTNLGPGEPWDADLAAYGERGAPLNAAPPVVRIRNEETGSSRTFRSTRVAGEPGRFRVTLTFPEEGVWQTSVRHGGEVWETQEVVIEAPTPVPASNSQVSDPRPISAPATDDGGFPLWPVLAGSIAAGLLGALGIASLRGRRLAPWPAAPSSARTASRGR